MGKFQLGDYVEFVAPDSRQLALVNGCKGKIISEKWGGYKVDFGTFEFISMENELKLIPPPDEPVKEKRHRRTKAEMQAARLQESEPEPEIKKVIDPDLMYKEVLF